MTSIALSNEMMSEFGKISDGISLYSSSFISSKMYQFYAIYSWLQILVGPLPTILLTQGLFSQILRDSSPEYAPTMLHSAKNMALNAITMGKSGLKSVAVKAAANQVATKIQPKTNNPIKTTNPFERNFDVKNLKTGYNKEIFGKEANFRYQAATRYKSYPDYKNSPGSNQEKSGPSKEMLKAKFKSVALNNSGSK